MYKLIRKLLFLLPPEMAHAVTLNSLQLAYRLGLLKLINKPTTHSHNVMGLHFPNNIGLAAGLDKNGDYIDALASLGFGFIEIGTITPKPQVGNPRPRLFRLTENTALINRMGFNNHGIDYALKNLEHMQYRGIIGINIGKNKDTPIAKAGDDYLACMQLLWKYASYFVINISSPNTAELRNLQQRALLNPLLDLLKQEQAAIFKKHQKYIPLVVKISPDMTLTELHEVAVILLEKKIDGVIATNTTISRHGVEASRYAHEAGGLSGKPLQAHSTQIIQELRAILKDHIPIIGVGGIIDQASANGKLAAGASLLQVYTGLIYAGPGLVKRITPPSLT